MKSPIELPLKRDTFPLESVILNEGKEKSTRNSAKTIKETCCPGELSEGWFQPQTVETRNLVSGLHVWERLVIQAVI